MQDFVEKFIAQKQAELGEKCKDALAPREEAIRAEREARLIRLGMCKKEYSESLVYSEKYPYQERKTGKFYRFVAFEVTDEEYAAICRYDNSAMELRPKRVSDRLYSKGARNYRRTAVLRFLLGTLVSLFAGVILYLIESDYLFLSVGVALLGIVNAHLAAVQVYTAGKSLERAEHLVALAEQNSEQ
jgi:hypothetical protein